MTSRTKILFGLLGVSVIAALVYFFPPNMDLILKENLTAEVVPTEAVTSTHDVVATPPSTRTDVEFTYVMEEVMPGSNLGTYPRITSHTSTETLKRVNSLLDEDRRMFGCSVATMTEEELQDEFLRNDIVIPSNLATLSYAQKMKLLGYGSFARTQVLYERKSILSMRTTMEYSCGGPYPVNALVYKTYDVASGKRAELPELFKNFVRDQDVLIEIFNKHYALGSQFPGSECGTTLSDESYLYADFFVSEEGFFISPSLPHVSQACGGDIEIPLDEIKPYLAPNSILTRLY